MSTFTTFFTSKWGLGLLALVVLGGGYWYVTHRGGPTYQFVSVTHGSIAQVVSVTGNTTPTKSVSLAFQNSGTVARVYYALGDKVAAGSIVAQLNTASLGAALSQAQANVSAQEAKLGSLKAGSQPADVATSQAALQKAQQDLANLYASISDLSTSGYTKANDAVRTQLNTLFSNAETTQPQLTYQTNASQATINAENLRVAAGTELSQWQQELQQINPSSSPSVLTSVIKKNIAHLAVIQNLLTTMSATLDASINLSASQLAADRASVGVGLTEVNAAISSFNTVSQNIASQQATVAQAQAQLALKHSGASAQDVAAQQAQIDQAQAGVASAYANLQGSQIVAPISGVLTQLDAKVGQIATPGTPLVSIIGSSGFEVDAGVSETDVGKIAVGNTVSMTLDAFAGETFSGTVFYIAPAQTNTQGVITYQIKIAFAKADPRLKSGLTANINIETSHKDGVLILPQYAILQNDQGTFVEVLENKVVKNIPVVLGIQDQKGNVEVTSGVTEGEQVLNIGLKK